MAKEKMFSAEEKKQLAAYYLEGNSLTETGVKFSISGGAVSLILEKQSIPCRSVAEGNALKWVSEKFRKNQTDKKKGMPTWNKGETHKLNHRKIVPSMSGSGNPMWKGEATKLDFLIRALPEYKVWRSKVFERDNWTCQISNKRTCVGSEIILPSE